MSTLQTAFAVTATVAVATVYVLIHEQRRKLKTERKKAGGADGSGQAARSGQAGGSGVITREQLIAILDESATAAFQLIEQVRSATPRLACQLASRESRIPRLALLPSAQLALMQQRAPQSQASRRPSPRARFEAPLSLPPTVPCVADAQDGVPEARADGHTPGAGGGRAAEGL